MKTTFAAIALAATLAQPASAVTFPSLTTIYVGSGVSGTSATATVIHCSNVSGVTANVRFLFLLPSGAFLNSHTASVVHGRTYSVATDDTPVFVESHAFLPSLSLAEGVVNVEATESGVFCNAKVVDKESFVPTGFTLPLVRVNAHPGTVE